MRPPAGIDRVVVVVLDGVRADAVPLYRLPTLTWLLERGAGSLAATTVTPSVTAAAMTSLLTGVPPQVHGIDSDRFGIPRRVDTLVPLPAWLARHGVPSFGFMATLPLAFRGLGQRIAHRLAAEIRFGGRGAEEILVGMSESLRTTRRGFWLCHWPDADRAGHSSGWTSPEYLRAVRRLDMLLGRLVSRFSLLTDPGAVLVVLSDHGGGGRRADCHESNHRLDVSIPLILAGGQVRATALLPGASLVDVPATIPWLLGVPRPLGYHGRVLTEAMLSPALPAVA